MKRLISWACLVALIFCTSITAFAEQPIAPEEDITTDIEAVYDYSKFSPETLVYDIETNSLTMEQLNELNIQFRSMADKTGVVPAFVIVGDYTGDPGEFSNKAYEFIYGEVESEPNGVICVMNTVTRDLSITSYGTMREVIDYDATTALANEVAANVKQPNFFGAVNVFINTVSDVSLIEVVTNVDGEPAIDLPSSSEGSVIPILEISSAPPSQVDENIETSNSYVFWIVALLIVFFIAAVACINSRKKANPNKTDEWTVPDSQDNVELENSGVFEDTPTNDPTNTDESDDNSN